MHQKIPKAGKIFEMFCDAYAIFNLTFYFTKNAEFQDLKKVGLFCPMPPGLGLNMLTNVE
jgi:hypothetical protein